MKKGSITIFLSLILVVSLSFLWAAVSSSALAGSRYLFTVASEAVTKSIFASYDTYAWEQYRILMLSDPYEAVETGRQCAVDYSSGSGMFDIKISSVGLSVTETLASDGAAAWQRQAVEYMGYCLPLDFVSWLWEQSSLSELWQDLTGWISSLSALFEPIVSVEQKLCQLEDSLNEAVLQFQKTRELLTDVSESANILKGLLTPQSGVDSGSGQTQGDSSDTGMITKAWVEVSDSLREALESCEKQEVQLSSLSEETASQLESTAMLKDEIQAMIDGLTDTADLISQSGIKDYLNTLTSRVTFLQDLPQQLADQFSFIEQAARIALPELEEVMNGGGLEALEAIADLAGELAGEEWQVSAAGMTEGTEEDSFHLSSLLNVKSWLEQGILALVLENPSSVSAASSGSSVIRTERTSEYGILERTYSNLLYGEYALRYTADYTEPDNYGLCYETEYLIAGRSSDRENLSEVASELLMIRGALNLTYLLTDSSKKAQADSVAAGISLLLGGFVPPSLLSVLLLVLWGLAEAVCDVRGLLAGESVSLIKNSAEWQLSWDRLLTIFDESAASGSRGGGMSYSDYLRLLLFLEPLEEKCFRTMDAAQDNLSAISSGFDISNAASCGQVTVAGTAGRRTYELMLTYGY